MAPNTAPIARPTTSNPGGGLVVRSAYAQERGREAALDLDFEVSVIARSC
jgi:hypothetical protein